MSKWGEKTMTSSYHRKLAFSFHTDPLPTILFFKDGEVINKVIRIKDKDALKYLLGI